MCGIDEAGSSIIIAAPCVAWAFRGAQIRSLPNLAEASVREPMRSPVRRFSPWRSRSRSDVWPANEPSILATEQRFTQEGTRFVRTPRPRS